MDAPAGTKLYASAEAALHDLGDGASIAVGGFGLCGNPEACIRAIAASGARGLTIVSNNCGNQGQGLAILLQRRQVARVVCSFVGGNPDLEQQMLAGEVEVQLNPQGTLAERLRAGGAGIPAFFTPTGAGTVVAEGKEVRDFAGRPCVLETAIRTDFAVVRAARGDALGNLQFYRTSTRSRRWPAGSPSPRSTSWSRSAPSTATPSTCRACSCSGSSTCRSTGTRSSSARPGRAPRAGEERRSFGPRRPDSRSRLPAAGPSLLASRRRGTMLAGARATG
jgi:3-oxoacid CoA-transferase subunit A